MAANNNLYHTPETLAAAYNPHPRLTLLLKTREPLSSFAFAALASDEMLVTKVPVSVY